MKYIIDDIVCKSKGLSLDKLLALLLIKTGTNIPLLFTEMERDELIVKDMFNNYLVTQHWDDVCADALLTSEKEIPKEDRLDILAESLRAIFPEGKKPGTVSTYWRGNLKDTRLRLKKFFKLYGTKYTDEQILDAAKRYVESFNGVYTYMRVLKYFIWKDEKKINAEGEGYIEETSDLATLIENTKDSEESNYIGNARLI